MHKSLRDEICYLIVEQLVLDKGLPGGSQLRQDLGNIAKKISERGHNVTVEDLMQVYEGIVPKLYGKIFGYTEVSIQASHRDDNS